MNQVAVCHSSSVGLAPVGDNNWQLHPNGTATLDSLSTRACPGGKHDSCCHQVIASDRGKPDGGHEMLFELFW